MTKKRIYFFIGTTAEFIKLAPIMKELKQRRSPFKIITSGQNTIKFEDLNKYTGSLKVDIALSEKTIKSSILHFLLWNIKSFLLSMVIFRTEFKGLNKENSLFFIHGDTISALMGALIAKRYGLKLVHVESGLRSFNFREPFPEEICRFMNIHLADLLFCPTQWAFENTKSLHGERINTEQNTLIEPCLWALSQPKAADYNKQFGKYFIIIMHRQEHVYFQKEWTRNTLDFIINNAPKDLNCIFILHALTSRFLESERLNTNEEANKRLFLVPTVPYADFMNLMNNAEFIATDGCTNQEEAYYMGLPMLSLRNVTERIEGLHENVVLSKNGTKIIKDFLKHYKKYRRKPVTLQSKPSKIIVDYLFR
jgi:UDP-N-acetylglucosamine 2-epimerase (non-hydrolysing)